MKLIQKTNVSENWIFRSHSLHPSLTMLRFFCGGFCGAFNMISFHAIFSVVHPFPPDSVHFRWLDFSFPRMLVLGICPCKLPHLFALLPPPPQYLIPNTEKLALRSKTCGSFPHQYIHYECIHLVKSESISFRSDSFNTTVLTHFNFFLCRKYKSLWIEATSHN